MAIAVIMPRDGQSVESCIITEFKVKKGDSVNAGDILFAYETDKSSFEKKADEAGVLLEVFYGEGDDVPCLETVCIIGKEGEDISALMPGKASVAPDAPAAPTPVATPAAPVAAAPVAAPVLPEGVTEIILPRDGQSVESCIITGWSKKVGDTVANGDILFSYETDKSSFDKKSDVEGTLLATFAEEGDDVPCLEVVCLVGKAGTDVSAYVNAKKNGGAVDAPVATTATVVAAPVAAPVSTKVEGDRLRISPRAKNLALRACADLSKTEPTGPLGRIIERDVNKALDNGFTATKEAIEKYLAGDKAALASVAPATAKAEAPKADAPVASGAEYNDIKLSGIRKTIAKSMHTSLSTMAQLTLNTSFNATALLKFRAGVKANGEKLGMANITLNDMVLFAVAKTLTKHKNLNAHWMDSFIRVFENVNLGVAVDTERGLMVPTIAKAETLSLNELAKQAKSLANETKTGSISPDKLTGGSFTVTNLGAFGIESFTPVINPPQVAILGVDGITKRVKENADGTLSTYSAMGLSLTFDHRAIDGAPAAKFLKDLCLGLENFDMLLAQ